MENYSKLLEESLREIITRMSKEELLTDFFKPGFVRKHKLHLLTEKQLKNAILRKEYGKKKHVKRSRQNT